MKEKKVKSLELNTKKLENFDKIMSTKLDEIEELKVTGLDKGSELLNIISLCANVKTLIIEGDPRLNSDKVLTNIFKPENLENLVLNNVKLPTGNALKRYTKLKRVSLNDIRFCNIKDFFARIINPNEVEMINISNSDMGNQTIAFLEKFEKLKHLKLKNLQNGKLEPLKFLKNNTELLKIEMADNSILPEELKHLINCKCTKNIVLSIINSEGTIIGNCKLKTEENVSEISIFVNHVEEIDKKMSCRKIKKINVIVNEIAESSYFIEFLQKAKSDFHIILYDFSCLNVEQANEIKEDLDLEEIEFASEKKNAPFDLETYIEIRQEIELAIQTIAGKLSEPERFLTIYQYLGKEFEISEKADITSRICTTFQICQLLRDCLKCEHINSNIIYGDEFENDKKHYWNQVQLDGKWYNADLSLDMENIKKNKVEYCLLGNQEFFDTHAPKSGKNNYCAENFNEKLINVFFKTGLFKEKLLASYIEIMIEKIKKLFRFNKNLSLPEAKIDDNAKN